MEESNHDELNVATSSRAKEFLWVSTAAVGHKIICLPQLENRMDTLNRMMLLFCVLTVFKTQTRSTVYSCSVSQEISQPGLFCLQLQNANSLLITLLAAGKIVFHILYVWCSKSEWTTPPTLTNKLASAESYYHFKFESNASHIPPACLPVNITSVFSHTFR